jgi:hypothetical protein
MDTGFPPARSLSISHSSGSMHRRAKADRKKIMVKIWSYSEMTFRRNVISL